MLDVGARVTKNQAPRNPQRGRRARQYDGDHDQPGDDQEVRDRFSKCDRYRPPVIRDQIPRPERQPKIFDDHHRLIEEIRPRTHTARKSGRMHPRSRPHHDRHDEPRQTQSEVQAPPRIERLLERIEQEDAVVERHHQRRGGHRLLAGHPRRAGPDRNRGPARGRLGRPCPQRRQQRDQVAQRHHQLAALGQVVDGFGVQRMKRPQNRRRERDPGRVRCRSFDGSQFERPPDEPEEDHSRRDVECDVDEVIAGDAEAPDRVVQCEGQVDERAAGRRQLALGLQHIAKSREVANARVFHHRQEIVKDKRSRQAVGVDEQREAGEDSGPHPAGPGLGGPGSDIISRCRFGSGLATGRA